MSLHRVATHEAGHAVAAVVLRMPVRYAAVFADGRGQTAYYPVPVTRSNIARRAVATLAAQPQSASGTAKLMPRAISCGCVTRSTDSVSTGTPARWSGTGAARWPWCGASVRQSTQSPLPCCSADG